VTSRRSSPAARIIDDAFSDRRWWQFIPIPLTIAMMVVYRGPYPIGGGYLTVYGIAFVIAIANLAILAYPRKPAWVSPIGLSVLALSGAALSFAIHESSTIALPYVVAIAAARRYRPRVSTWVVLIAMVSVALSQLLLGARWPGIVASVAVIAAMGLGSFARRSRADRLEQVELALAREQTAREEHARAAALSERARIAREIHDVLAHSLSALSLNLQGARLMMERDDASAEALDQVRRAQRLAADGLAEARRAVATLREDDPIQAARAIADLVTVARLETGAQGQLTVEGTPRDLSGPAESALYRTAQEALSNTRKHAPGAPVDVLLRYSDQQTELTVTDHPGRRPPDGTPGGYGLTGMRERAELIGGTLHVGPIEDGWQVRLVVPT
jgi:signal transduction histidine kinase